MLTIDDLAQEIRRVDGSHSLGAGALAEALMPFLTAALVDVQAVEPVAHIIEGPNGEDPRVYLTQKYDPRIPDFWLNEEARAKHRVTPLYTSPPLSREGEDAKAEQYWSAVEQLANCEDEISRLRALLSRAEEYVIDGVTNAKAEAEMNAPYPARAPRYDAALAEVRQLYADIQAALAATRSGSATTSKGVSE